MSLKQQQQRVPISLIAIRTLALTIAFALGSITTTIHTLSLLAPADVLSGAPPAEGAPQSALETGGDENGGGDSSGSASSTPSSATSTVMAFAMKYDLLTHQKFVGSLRKSGFDGNIILGVEAGIDAKIRSYLEEKGVTLRELQFANCTYDWEVKAGNSHSVERNTCAAQYPNIKVRWSRFPLQRDWLRDCSECTGPVLISDYRDAIFQENPFAAGAPPVRGLQVFEEHRSITTDHWLVQSPVMKCKGIVFKNRPMLCSGTTIGTRDAMLQYLGSMYDEMSVWIADTKCHFEMNGDDQSIHNYLFYSGKLPYAIPIPHRTGIVHTAGAQGSIILHAHRERLKEEKDMETGEASRSPFTGTTKGMNWIGTQFDLTDEKGYFVNMDGTRSRVVHQHDRFGPNLASWLSSGEGKKIWD